VVHLRYATRDSLLGLSPLEWARTSTAFVAAQARLAREQTERGFTGDLVFEMAGTFQGEHADSAFKRLKNQLTSWLPSTL
jgi:phage portal protein BeeE